MLDADGAGNIWFCQREECQHLAPFEEILMHHSSHLFFVPLYQVFTLEEDLIDTSVAETLMKKISARKANKE